MISQTPRRAERAEVHFRVYYKLASDPTTEEALPSHTIQEEHKIEPKWY